MKNRVCKITSKPPDFHRADFGLFKGMVMTVPWEAVLKDKRLQEDWILFEKEILKVQEQAVPMSQKICRWERRPV